MVQNKGNRHTKKMTKKSNNFSNISYPYKAGTEIDLVLGAPINSPKIPSL